MNKPLATDLTAVPLSPTAETRREQMFLRLDDREIDRLRRFGEECRFPEGA